ncbi:MAG: hypothetical protein WCJ26_04260 [bacterium]
MNDGMIIGQAFFQGRPAPDVWVCLDYIEGTSERNTGRGLRGAPLGITLYNQAEVPAAGPIIAVTNSNGGFLIRFKWDFLGITGTPNDMAPFYHAHADRFTNERIPQVAGPPARTRRRGRIIASPRSVSELMGVNVPIDPEGIAGQAIDIAALWRDVGVSVPCPLVGRSIIETRMFIGYWVFSMSDR